MYLKICAKDGSKIYIMFIRSFKWLEMLCKGTYIVYSCETEGFVVHSRILTERG